MKIKWMIIFVAILSLLLSACATTGTGTKTGAGLGAITGAITGVALAKDQHRDAKIVAGVLGAITGAFVGGWLGSQWDERDENTAQEILNKYPDGKTGSWENPDTDKKFSVTPVKTYTNNEGQRCRDFKLVGNVNGSQKEDAGKACRSSKHGRWQITSA